MGPLGVQSQAVGVCRRFQALVGSSLGLGPRSWQDWEGSGQGSGLALFPLNPLVILRMETSLTGDCEPLKRSRKPWFTKVLLLNISIFLKKLK